MGQTAERQLQGGSRGLPWHHRISSRTDYDLLNVDEESSGNILKSNLFSMTPVQAMKGVGSIWDLARNLPFGRLSNFQKQKYQALTTKFTDAHIVEQSAYDALRQARVPDAFPIIGQRMVSTENLEQQNEQFSKIWGNIAGTATDPQGNIVGGTRRLRDSFPVYTMFLPTGDRLVVEDQGLFTSKQVMKGTFNFGKGVSQPIHVKTPEAVRLMNPENFDKVTGMTLLDYMESLNYDDRVINMIKDTGAGNMKMSSFMEGNPLPVYSHSQAIDMLSQTTTSRGILQPGQVFLKGESEKSFRSQDGDLIRRSAKVKNKLKYNSVITDVTWQRESGDLIFNVIAADKPSIVKLVTANKESKGTIETLSRLLVQAGIKMKVGEQAVETRKETLETKAQQKLYRNIMKKDFNAYEKAKKENSGNDK